MTLAAATPLPSDRREKGHLAAASALLTPATAVVAVMLVAPLLLLLRMSFNRFDPTKLMVEAATAENYTRFFGDAYYTDVMITTVVVALSSTAFCLLFGFPIAYRLARWQSRWKNAVMLLMVLPLFVSSTVRSIGWRVLFSHGGVINLAATSLGLGTMTLMQTTTGVIIGIISINLPYMILTLQSVVEGIDENLEQAAESLGAAPARAFWRIVWPMALPGTMIAAVLCFILAMNAFATPVLIGGPRFHMMAPLLYWEFTANNNWPFASALALILMTTTLVMTVLANKLILGRQARA
jgi:putative spermidine/putrescine transport system permease protein